jgi:hypothetical protein
MNRKVKYLVVPLAAAAVALSGGVAMAAQSSAKPAATGLIWEGLTSKGTSVFQGLEKDPGTITVANDPTGTYGQSFRYETWDHPGGGKSRCESRGVAGFTLNAAQVGKTFYVGWKAYWDVQITKGAWTSFWQLHWSGAGPGGGPMTVRTIGDGKLAVQYVSPDGKVDRNIWTSPLPMKKWDSFVIAFKLAKDSSGFIQFWYNGVQQKFVNGSASYPGAIFKGTQVNLKWGVYRSGVNKGHGVQFVNDPKLGTTYDSVKP